ncbi:MAG: KH domain-containing protein [Lachnospiraceae bacterium]|nr:KH domain-containing protein [Lachnospiraceae bacterium]
MKDLVIVLAKALVEHPDEVSVIETETDTDITLRLKVADEDMGKVIGKGGRIAKAIRTLVKASAFNTEKKIFVEIGEED